ncbi:aminodeoxychorismate/anthranilate synthase component II [bacterium]|nr:aminodeoxychorismate/anthranilate synthase component II [bacterium]
MILLIDNYDSFVHNLARYVRELGLPAEIVRNDALTVAEIAHQKPAAIIISPGPCTPLEAGISMAVVQQLAGTIPILGVCLGHQAIAAALGGLVIRAPEPVHGRTSWIRHQGTPLFAGISNPFPAARYHSLIVDEAHLPEKLQVTARTTDGLPMAIEHTTAAVYGVQFHPESVLTHFGHQLLTNFLRLAGVTVPMLPARSGETQQPASVVQFGPPVSPVAWPAPVTSVE